MELLIDGDPIVYRIGFACQSKDKDSGLVTADSESFTLHSCKQFVNAIIKETECSSYRMYISGRRNFRNKVVDDYKANRAGKSKPVHYNLIRDYLTRKFKAQLIEDIEADDALGLAQTPNTAIATIDKDLLMVEGKHYNYIKKEWKQVTAEEGTRFFYKQMITGDKVDNITGIYGLGEKKASKLLDETPREEWDKLILDLYDKEFDNGFHRAVQNSQLLWILQRDKQMPMDFK